MVCELFLHKAVIKKVPRISHFWRNTYFFPLKSLEEVYSSSLLCCGFGKQLALSLFVLRFILVLESMLLTDPESFFKFEA